MHDCAPCQQFTPVFTELYNEVNVDEKVIEVVYLSGDKTQAEYDDYYGKMPWLALPRGDPRIRNLAQKYNVKGVPQLIIVKPDGTLVDKEGVKRIKNEGPVAIEEYLTN